jgi:hypothetical protein
MKAHISKTNKPKKKYTEKELNQIIDSFINFLKKSKEVSNNDKR